MRYTFFFNDAATANIYTLSLHDALPICWTSRYHPRPLIGRFQRPRIASCASRWVSSPAATFALRWRSCALMRSEEHTSELQSRQYIVCRLLLEKNITLRYAATPFPPLVS